LVKTEYLTIVSVEHFRHSRQFMLPELSLMWWTYLLRHGQ